MKTMTELPFAASAAEIFQRPAAHVSAHFRGTGVPAGVRWRFGFDGTTVTEPDSRTRVLTV